MRNFSVIENNSSRQRIPADVVELAEKLDAMLTLVVQFIEKSVTTVIVQQSFTTTATSSVSNTIISDSTAMNTLNSQQDRLFNQLITIFEERILSTHKSKFVQYLLFYFVSKSGDVHTNNSDLYYTSFHFIAV